jgi:hypothetical protein
MKYEEFSQLIQKTLKTASDAEDVAKLLYPLFETVELQGKTPLIRLEPRTEQQLDMLYFWADHIKAMGARSVLFLPLSAEIAILDLVGKSVTLKLNATDPDMVHKYAEWVRVAGAEHVCVLQSGESLEIGESNGNSKN